MDRGRCLVVLMQLVKLPGPDITDEELRSGKIGYLLNELFYGMGPEQINAQVLGSFPKEEQRLLHALGVRRYYLL